MHEVDQTSANNGEEAKAHFKGDNTEFDRYEGSVQVRCHKQQIQIKQADLNSVGCHTSVA
jgi:hypothetical protein